jgi:LL-H family phage holin
MTINNFAELVTSLAVVTLPVIAAWLSKFIKKNKTAQSLLEILPTLAKDAVVAMQKLGVSRYIDGAVKKSNAAKIVADALSNLGFSKTDDETIKNAIESAYASLLSDGTLAQYTQAEPDSSDSMAATEADLASLKQTLTSAAAVINSLADATVQSSTPAPADGGDSSAAQV